MQKNLVYIDTLSASQIDESGNFIRSTNDLICIERGQWQILCINFVSRDLDAFGTISLKPVDMSGVSYLLVGDNNFADDDSLMIKSYQSATPFDQHDPLSNRFNLEGDWIGGGTADPSQGQMSIRINADTAKFKEVTGTKESITSGLYLQLKQYSAGIDNPSSVMRIRFCAKNTIRDWGTSIEEPPSNTQVVAAISAYLNAGFELEFSNNATDWHLQQGASDVYFRMRLRNSGAAWSTAIRLPEGVAGADGKDGIDGKTPEKGVDYWTEADKQEIKDYVDSAILNGEW